MDKQPINYLDLEIEDDNPQWMKLVDYVNQREEETFPVPIHYTYENRFDDVHMFSKRLGFVKWLVENDKINREDEVLQYLKEDMSTFFEQWENIDGTDTDDIDLIVMILAIQNNPITAMLSILK